MGIPQITLERLQAPMASTQDGGSLASLSLWTRAVYRTSPAATPLPGAAHRIA
jgi:hypothetical protein